MKRVFLTFADRRLHRSVTRISKQAEAMRAYDVIQSADETWLEGSFRRKFADKLVRGSRGFGYWCWKPQLLLQTFQALCDSDIVQYTDAGCHMNPLGRRRLLQYFAMTDASSTGILAFQARPPEAPLVYDGRKLPDWRESYWVKGDLVDHFGVRRSDAIVHSPTIVATTFFVRKCASSTELIRTWMNIIETDFSLLDDTPSRSPNFPGFIEHRHDQSIFSLLCKLRHVDTLSSCEHDYPKRTSMEADWEALREFPIHAKRDKDLGPAARAVHWLRKLGSRLKTTVYGVVR